MYCRYCGQNIPDESCFCGKCGKPTKGPVLDSRSRPALTGYAKIWPALIIGLSLVSFLLYLVSSVTVESFVGERTYHLAFPDSWPPILRDAGEAADLIKVFTLFAMVLMLLMVIAGAATRQKPYCFWGSLMALYALVSIMMLVLNLLHEAGGGLYEVKGQPVAMTLSALLFCALLILAIFSPKGIKHLSKGWAVPTVIFAAVTSVLGQISGSIYSGSTSKLIFLSLLCSAGMIAAAMTKKYIICIFTAVITAVLQYLGNPELLTQGSDFITPDTMSYVLFSMFCIVACITTVILSFAAHRRQGIQSTLPPP